MNTQEPNGRAVPNAATSASTATSGASASHSMDEALPYGNATIADGKAGWTRIGPLTDRLLQLIEGRALEPELLVMRGVGASVMPGGDWIAIPYFENGARVGTKHRTLGQRKTFSQDAGSAQILWNVDCLRDPTLKDEPLIITEGEMDAFAAIQCGFPRTVSVPGGAPAAQMGEEKAGKKYGFLDAAEPLLKDVKEIILAADGDGPGSNLLADMALRLGKTRCKWLRYPKECKDLNDALIRYQQNGVVKTLRRAQWYPVPGIYRMSELPPADVMPALQIGIDGFGDGSGDRPTVLARRGDLWVITGIPGHGKSSLINEICCRLAVQHGWSSMFASFEQQPTLDHRRALRSFHAGKAEIEMSRPERDAADQWIDEHFSFMVPDEDDEVDLAWVLDRCGVAVRRFGSDVLSIDPWNEMDHVRPPDMSLTEYTGYAIKQFKRFAKRNHVLLIIAAHPAKMHRDKTGKYPIPTLYDISDSSHWANKPDIGIVVHRDSLEPGGESRIRIPKVRYHGVIGVPGEIERLIWSRKTTRYFQKRDPTVGHEDDAA